MAARRAAAAAADRGAAPVDEVEPDVHRQPADRARHADHRRPVVAARLEAPRVGPPGGVAASVDPLEAEPATERRDEVGDPRRVDDQRAHPLGAEQPLLGGRPRTGRRRARRSGPGSRRPPARRRRPPGRRGRGRARRSGRRADRAGRPQHVRDRDQPGVGRDRGLERGDSVRSSSPSSPASTKTTSTPIRSRSAMSGPMPAGVLVGASSRHGRRLASRAAASRRSSRRSWRGSGRPRRRRSPSTAATPARASAIRCRKSARCRRGARARRRARGASISAIAAAVSAGSGPTDPVFR